MATPDYLICLDCETPCYIFEWEEGQVVEAVCTSCGNDDPAGFLSPDDFEDLSGWSEPDGRRR